MRFSAPIFAFVLCLLGASVSFAGDLSFAPNTPVIELTREQTSFANDLEKRALLYFVEHTDPHTGLTQDKAPALGVSGYAPASVAASGFALSAWCIATERGWMPRDQAKDLTTRTLSFMLEKVEHKNGWLYHFVDMQTGKRVWKSEASTIDTALFLNGAVTAREYFSDPEITRLVNALYDRIDWNWATNGGSTLTHGWRPETGFIGWRWDSYSELMSLYLLGIGAGKDPLPSNSWHAWKRGEKFRYQEFEYFPSASLFTHQYSHAWFDFHGKRDAYGNYWKNSVAATLAQQAWCASLKSLYPSWSETLWGLTASDSANGYRGWGGPSPSYDSMLDGTLVPCAPGGSLPFAPQACLTALMAMKDLNLEGLWGRYGFADAFNVETNWVSPDVLSIDCGITLIMAENMRTGLIWRNFMKSAEAQRALTLAGFENDTTDALATFP